MTRIRQKGSTPSMPKKKNGSSESGEWMAHAFGLPPGSGSTPSIGLQDSGQFGHVHVVPQRYRSTLARRPVEGAMANPETSAYRVP